jgi:diacylglycerol O-acyltransferase / wax synthase
VDAAWYHIDGPVNFAQVTACLLTRKPLAFDKVRAVYRQRLARFARFRQRVVETGFPVASPRWEDMPDFDIGQQLHHIALPEPRDHAALAALIGDLASTPLDRARPLWEVHVVDHVDGGSALIMRMHHCIGDGTAAMALSRDLFDTTRDGPAAAAPPPARRTHRAAGIIDGLVDPVLASVGALSRTALAAAGGAVAAIRDPRSLVRNAALAADGVGMLIGELRKRPDPSSPLKGRFGLAKRVAWSAPVALADVKAIGATSGAKVNDVLVAGMTGALRAYLRKRGADVDGTTVRALVPVDLRPPGRGAELGNEFGLVILELPVDRGRAADRVRAVKARMDALKRSPEPIAILALFDLFGRVPKAIEDFAVDLFGRKASVVMTNVTGPKRRLYLAGTAIDRFMFWVPHPGRQLGMGISIMSYNGYATLAVVADAGLVPDPEAVTDGFNREFARMLKAVRRVRAHARRGGTPARTTVSAKR